MPDRRPMSQFIKAQGDHRGWEYIVACEPHPSTPDGRWWAGYIRPRAAWTSGSHDWSQGSYKRLGVGARDEADGVNLCRDCIDYEYLIEAWEKQHGAKYDAIKHGPLTPESVGKSTLDLTQFYTTVRSHPHLVRATPLVDLGVPERLMNWLANHSLITVGSFLKVATDEGNLMSLRNAGKQGVGACMDMAIALKNRLKQEDTKAGDVVQITKSCNDNERGLVGFLVVVTAVQKWGVSGFIPNMSGDPTPIKRAWDYVDRIGPAALFPGQSLAARDWSRCPTDNTQQGAQHACGHGDRNR